MEIIINICKYIIVLICITNHNTNAQSYFFTPEQSNAILENLNKPKEKRKDKKKKIIKKIEYKLSGICYMSPDNWIVWINGQAYNKIGQYNHFSIDEVSQDSVTITTSDCKTIHLSVKCEDNIQKNKTNIDKYINIEENKEQNKRKSK